VTEIWKIEIQDFEIWKIEIQDFEIWDFEIQEIDTLEIKFGILITYHPI